MDLHAFSDALKAELLSETHAAVQAALLACLPAVIRQAQLPLYLNSSELSKLTGWSQRKIAYLRSKRQLPFIRRGRTVLFRTADIEEYLDEGLVAAWRTGAEDSGSRPTPNGSRAATGGARNASATTSPAPHTRSGPP